MKPEQMIINALGGALAGYFFGYIMFEEFLPDLYTSLSDKTASPQGQEVIEQSKENLYQSYSTLKLGKFITAILGALIGMTGGKIKL